MVLPSPFKQVATPGSIGFLELSLVIALALRYLWPRSPRISGAWLLILAVVYPLLALPWVANGIANLLPFRPQPTPSSPAVDVLVVLDGDNRRGRVGQAHALYTNAAPETVYVLGDDWIVTALVGSGVPRDRIAQDPVPSTTRAQVDWVQRRMASGRGVRMAVVASRLQMPRVAALANEAGLSLTLVSSPIDDEPPTEGPRLFVPTYIALRVSRDALYEHAALRYYQWRGWIRSR